MTRSTQERVVLFATEATPGSDAIVGLSSDAQALLARPVEEFTLEHVQEFDDETEGSSGTQSNTAGAGREESATATLRMRLRAGNGSATTDPAWVAPLLSCGWKKDSTNGYKLSSLTVTNLQAQVANGEHTAIYFLGERVYASVATLGNQANWETAAYTGSGTDTDAPLAGALVKIWPVGGSESSPIATGVVGDDVTDGTILIRLDHGSTALPKSGMHIRAGDSYNKLNADLPVGIVTRWINNEATSAGTSVLYIWKIQGTWTGGSTAMVVGADSHTIGTDFSGAQYGSVFLPESRSQITLTVGSWSNGNPKLGSIITRYDDQSNALAALKVTAATSTTVTGVPIALFGTFANGGNLQGVNSSDALTEGTQSGAAAPLGAPTGSIHDIAGGFRRRALGVRGNAEFSAEAGTFARIAMTFEGGTGPLPDEVVHPSNIALPTHQAPRWENGIAEIFGKRLTVRQFNATLNAQITKRTSANAAGGVLASSSDERSGPSVGFTLDREGLVDPWEQWRSQGTAIPAGVNLGSTEGNLISIVWQLLQVRSHSHGEDGKRMTVSPECRPCGGNGDDEMIIHQI